MEKAVRTLGITEKYQDMDPGKALLEEVSVTYAFVPWLREKVGQLEETDKLTRGTEDRTYYSRDGDAEEYEGSHESRNPGAHALVWGQTEYRDRSAETTPAKPPSNRLA